MRTRTRAHVSTAGVTTSAPARSDNHQVRQMCPKPTAGRSPAIQIASVPSVAPTAVPTAEHAIRTSTSLTRRPGVRAPRRMSSRAATTTATTVPSV